MSVQEYIASGILEVYILGGLEVTEQLEVEAMAAQYPEVRQEIQVLRETLEIYTNTLSSNTSVNVKKKLFEALEKENSVIPLSNQLKWYKLSLAASVVLFIISGFVAFLFFQKWSDSESQLMVLKEEKKLYAETYTKANLKLNQLSAASDLLRDTSFVKVNLKGVAAYPGTMAVVFWNKYTQELYIDPVNLPKAEEGMQYQLWALQDGKPMDAGVFNSFVESGYQKVKTTKKAQAFAVTLEKKGGSPTPTLSAMIVFGEG